MPIVDRIARLILLVNTLLMLAAVGTYWLERTWPGSAQWFPLAPPADVAPAPASDPSRLAAV